MRTLRLVLLGIFLVVIVVLCVANRDAVTLNLLPQGMSGVLSLSMQVPLFLVILVSVVVGLIVGYLVEWLREHKHRRAASVKAQEAARLNREIIRLRKETGKPEDDVLALIGG